MKRNVVKLDCYSQGCSFSLFNGHGILNIMYSSMFFAIRSHWLKCQNKSSEKKAIIYDLIVVLGISKPYYFKIVL
jgi:hypothetical protein